jgi:hypothetical protein
VSRGTEPARKRSTHLDTPTRTEPAHREAFTTITKAQVAYPQILSAYDAVGAWVKAGDHVPTGSPREVYFTDFAAAGPHGPVADTSTALAVR